MRKLFLALILVTRALSLLAQDQPTYDYHKGIFIFGGIGPAIPLGDFGNERESGFDLNTAIDYRFGDHFFVRGMFDFSNFKFEPGAIQQDLGGTNTDIGGNNNLISLLISGGYYYPLGRFTPYVFGGVGASFVSFPEVIFNPIQNSLDIETTIAPHFSHVLGLGADFALNPAQAGEEQKGTLYLIYFESFFTRIPGDTDISVHEFGLLTFNIGIKTSF